MQPPVPTAEESCAVNYGGTENTITHLPAITLFYILNHTQIHTGWTFQVFEATIV